MPATEGPDGVLRRRATLQTWSQMKSEVSAIVNKTGGVQPNLKHRSKPQRETAEKEPVGPAEFNGFFFPEISE